jgi:hypothetical protein
VISMGSCAKSMIDSRATLNFRGGATTVSHEGLDLDRKAMVAIQETDCIIEEGSLDNIQGGYDKPKVGSL